MSEHTANRGGWGERVTCPRCGLSVYTCGSGKSFRTRYHHPCMNVPLAAPEPCHCGQPVTYGYDGNPSHHRGMCEHCDLVRCDSYPGACGR